MWTAHERLLWQILIAIAIFDAGIVLAHGISITGVDVVFLAGLLAFLTFGVFYRVVRGVEPAARCVIALTQVTVFAILLALASYVALTFDRPLIDSVLFDFDQTIGFNWPNAFVTVMSAPWLRYPLMIAYNSTQMQVILMAVALSLAGVTARQDKFLLSFLIGGVLSIAIWSLYPSFGAATFVYSTVASANLPHLDLVYNFVKPQLALRSGVLSSIDLSKMTGLVGAPSFHTVMALVTVRAVAGLGKWFWPVAAWNVLVLASIPVLGGHHVTDMIAGAVVAAVAIVVAEWIAAGMVEKPRASAAEYAGTLAAAE